MTPGTPTSSPTCCPARVIGVACLLLCLPFGPAMSVRLFVGVSLGFAWITAYAISLLRRRSVASR